MNFLDVEVQAVKDGSITVANEALDPVVLRAPRGAFQPGQMAKLGVRPQYLRPTPNPSDGMLHGTVQLTERLGSETVVEVRLRNGASLIAAIAQDTNFAIGTELNLTFDVSQVHLFGEPYE